MYERYAGRVHRTCVDRLGDRDEAADAVQDTFLKAWLALRNGVEVRHPLPWLLAIADNVCVSRFRARGARVATTSLSDDATVDFPEAVGEVAGLVAAFRVLPVRQRQALVRRELQGYSYDEIGAELGVSHASVAALLHRARLAVADTLREARRGIAAIVPIPAVLRAPFEGGAAAGAAVAGTAVIAVSQLGGASPAPSVGATQPPAATISVAAPSGDLVVGARASARTHSGRQTARAARATGSTQLRESRSGAPQTDRVGVLGATSVATGESTSAHVPRTVPNEEPAGDAAPPGERVPEPTPTAAADPIATAPEIVDQERTAAPISPPGDASNGEAVPPGKQPKGERGRSASAPGHTDKPEPTPSNQDDEPPGSSREPGEKGKGHEDAPGPPGSPGAGPPDPPPGQADGNPGQGNGPSKDAEPGADEDTGKPGNGAGGGPPRDKKP
jgi:RNA polymerase sigma factor (sigma-70 family)